tara:strand:- start:165 stop:347 length:183 start_codon:yes stop_codon:yes gene_type:complete
MKQYKCSSEMTIEEFKKDLEEIRARAREVNPTKNNTRHKKGKLPLTVSNALFYNRTRKKN